MLYGFNVYRSKEDGGDRIKASGLVYGSPFDGWAEKVLPFNKLKYAVTEDGELLVLDMDTGAFDKVPEAGKLIVQYGAGTLEEY